MSKKKRQITTEMFLAQLIGGRAKDYEVLFMNFKKIENDIKVEIEVRKKSNV